MTLVGSILGFSAFGLVSRFGQLAIQKRNLADNLGGHLIAMGVFGAAGYYMHQWDERAAVLLAAKRKQIAERRSASGVEAEA
ncbi:hypothetical protein CONPUDRAFT_120111 [Coniophora puteana RWD-64-598 SS2]|uniref:Uncharacterized protein n=1 Tax=Coniophora puteana (strain RWD-64-598) TaxID=741705 RepID=A0A5M3MYW3_CONPW|nr:uncharacterized protein CONPUDRAFT_120111 [Coniophora puteana RWD-64-598 SS2]EIW84338.1 hypothetical protein CONPUDRAFT_120111 [Coniophora puteana RWD-64-598 SS2]